MVEAEAWGWGSTRTIAVFGVGVVCLAAFWVIEHRVQRPIVEFSLFRNRPYFGATAAGFAIVSRTGR